jgi:hypothetical protein
MQTEFIEIQLLKSALVLEKKKGATSVQSGDFL